MTADEALAIVARRYFSPGELEGSDVAAMLQVARRQARGYAGWVVAGDTLWYADGRDEDGEAYALPIIKRADRG